MDASLSDAAPVARYLDDCPVLRSEGRRFEVAVEHSARHDERPLEVQVEAAVRRTLAKTRLRDRQVTADVLERLAANLVAAQFDPR